MTIAFIIPTYNERENIVDLVPAVLAQNDDIHVIVVDDNSPDGTGELVEELAEKFPGRVAVIHRAGKLGLGTAYRAGFQLAIEWGADPICTMDADFSHDPRYIPAMLKDSPLHDLVIGSRYVPGGGVRNWGWHRKLLSKGANLVARTLLGLEAHDCTGGFRAYRLGLLQSLHLDEIQADGYSYLVEMLFRCQRAGTKIKEVPIIFEDRRRGASKISQKEILKAMGTVAHLALTRLTRD